MKSSSLTYLNIEEDLLNRIISENKDKPISAIVNKLKELLRTKKDK